MEFVIVNGTNEVTKKIPLERYLKFIDKWTKNGNALIENMHMKTTTLKQNYGQQKSALAIKAELSGILRPIDFEQLEIEKRQFLETIDVKNKHFIGLKMATGNAALVLSTQRKMLLQSEEQLTNIKEKQAKAQRSIEKMYTEEAALLNEIDQWQDRIDKIRNKIKKNINTSFNISIKKIMLNNNNNNNKSAATTLYI